MGFGCSGLAQPAQCSFRLTQPEQHPAHRILDRRIFGVQRQRALDQAQRFALTVGAVRQGVAQRIERDRIFRVPLDDGAQVLLGQLDLLQPHRQHRPRVQKVHAFRHLGQCIAVQRQRLLGLAGIAQNLSLGQPAALPQIGPAPLAQSNQQRLCLDSTSEPRQNDRLAQLRLGCRGPANPRVPDRGLAVQLQHFGQHPGQPGMTIRVAGVGQQGQALPRRSCRAHSTDVFQQRARDIEHFRVLFKSLEQRQRLRASALLAQHL